MSTLLPPLLNLVQTLLPPLMQIVSAILPPIASLLATVLPIITQIVSAVLPVLVSIICVSLLEQRHHAAALAPAVLFWNPSPACSARLSAGYRRSSASAPASSPRSPACLEVEAAAAPTVSGYATGGFTRGPSIAGEDPRYPTEAVISFNPAYRSQNLSYWAEAGRMLGASDSEADYEPISGGSGTAVVYDLSGLSFSPQIKVEGDTDEDALIRKLRDLEPEFIDFILEALSRREGGAYVTADSRLY